MKSIFLVLSICLCVLSCNQDPEQSFNFNKEPLSASAQVKTQQWVGYKTFAFELQEMATNFSKAYITQHINELLSASQSVVYSMPNDLRNDIMNEKALSLKEATQTLGNSIEDKTEETIKIELKKVLKAFDILNEEINYTVNN